MDSLILDPIFLFRQRQVTGARVHTRDGDSAAVEAALRLTEVFKTQPGFECLYVCLAGETTADLALLRPILQLLQAAPEARTMLSLVYRPLPGPGQLSTALSLLSALDVELCLDLGELTADTLRRAAELPAQTLGVDAGLLCRADGSVKALLRAARRELLAWDVTERSCLDELAALGCRYAHGSLLGAPMTLPGFFRAQRKVSDRGRERL